MLLVYDIIFLVILAAGLWWLTGNDKTYGGESKRGHYFTRALRCVMVLFLVSAILFFAQVPALSIMTIPVLVVCTLSIAIILRSSVSELFAHGFLRMIDPMMHNGSQFDPRKAQRYRDAIARMIHSGHRDEAIKLCEELKKSGELDLATIQNTLEYLGVEQDRRPVTRPMVEAARLREEKKFAEAETLLKSLLARNPADADAALMLMRVHAQDLRQPAKAYEVLNHFEKQPYVSKDHVEIARRSIAEWACAPRGAAAAPPKMDEPANPETVDKLIGQGSFGGAVRMLEELLKTDPANLGLQLKLAEVYAVHCSNYPRAEKIVGQIERAASNPEIKVMARAKLAEWRLAHGGGYHLS